MTTDTDHYSKAAHFAERAEQVHDVLAKATAESGGVRADFHVAFMAEAHALAALAQVHATLAAMPRQVAGR